MIDNSGRVNEMVGVPVEQLAGARGAADVARGDEDRGDHRRADTRVGEDLKQAGDLRREGGRIRHACARAMCTAYARHVHCVCAACALCNVHCMCTYVCARLGREEDDGVDARELLEDEEEARDGHELAVARAQQLPPAATHRLARLHRGHGRTRAPQPGRRLLGLGLAPRLGEVGLGLGLRLGLGLGLRLGSGLGLGVGLGLDASCLTAAAGRSYVPSPVAPL